MVLYLALMRVLFMALDLRPRALAAPFWRERVFWGGLIGVLAIWAVGYRLSGGGSGVVAGTVSLAEYVSYFRILWVPLLPAVFGVTLPGAGLDTGQTYSRPSCSWLRAGGGSVLRPQAHRLAGMFLAVVVSLTGLLVARARIPQFGVGIGGDPRYLLDFAWLVPLTVCFAFSGRTALSPALDDRPHPRQHRTGGDWRWPLPTWR